jgi:serine/threonine protein phosphatase PrpC
MEDVAAPGARRLHRSLTKVRADSSGQSLVDTEDASAKDNDVYGSDIASSDEENQEEEAEQYVAASSSAASIGRRNGIRLQDVASLSVEGSQGHANEDRCVVASNERFHLLAVMDGHGGSWAGDFLVEKLFNTLDGVYDDGFDHVELSKAMDELDRTFCAKATQKMDTSGACLLAVLLYVDPNTDTPQKIVLNIGDCRAIVRETPAIVGKQAKGRAPASSKTFALSEDHCAGNMKERVRAVRSGAFIQNNRIAGVLEPFRTIGDIDMKGPGMKNWVIPTPEIRQSELLVGRSILVIATDGVWCVLNNNRAMALAVKELGASGTRPSAEAAAQAIVAEARELGSCDDITVIVVSV